MYIIINEDDTLHTRPGPAYPGGLEAVGPEGWNRVRVEPVHNMAGFCSDVGLIMPGKYRRNITGSCVLAALGASEQPYGGPLVITGWEDAATDRGDIEVTDLTDPQARFVRSLHKAVTAALAGDDPTALTIVGTSSPGWPGQVRGLAEMVRTRGTPAMQWGVR